MDHNNESISATELVRNLSSVIDAVRISGKRLNITKGSQIIATLISPPKTGLSLDQLINLLKSLPKLDDDALKMADDLKMIRNSAQLPENPWD